MPVQVLRERFFIIACFISSRVKVQYTILENSEKYQEKGHATIIVSPVHCVIVSTSVI